MTECAKKSYLTLQKHEAPVCEKESVVYARVKVFFTLLEKGSRPINQIDRKRRKEKKEHYFSPQMLLRGIGEVSEGRLLMVLCRK